MMRYLSSTYQVAEIFRLGNCRKDQKVCSQYSTCANFRAIDQAHTRLLCGTQARITSSTR